MRLSVVHALTDLPNQIAEFVDVFNDAFGRAGASGVPFGDRLPHHEQRQGFVMIAGHADDSDELVGFAYGYIGSKGQWWTDWVTGQVPAQIAATWLGGHFEVCEIAVRTAFQRQGNGRTLMTALLASTDRHRALLTTASNNEPARALYSSMDWSLLAEGLSDDYCLYGKILPGPEASK